MGADEMMRESLEGISVWGLQVLQLSCDHEGKTWEWSQDPEDGIAEASDREKLGQKSSY